MGIWIRAARPQTLWAAVAPVLVGSGLAFHAGVFRWDAFVAALVGAVAIQIGANFANDVSDAARGAATPDRIGPARAVAGGVVSPRQMWIAVWVAFALAALAGVYLIVVAGFVVAIIGIVSIAAALSYVGGPIPYGYRALGEVFVFAFFGVVATVGSRYVHDMTAPLDAWLLAIPVGMLVTAILVANNIRDIETDEATGKRTLAVLLGRRRTAALFASLVIGAPVLVAVLAVTRLTPLLTAAAVLFVPFSVSLARTVRSEIDGPPLIRALVGTARLHLAVGATIAIGSLF